MDTSQVSRLRIAKGVILAEEVAQIVADERARVTGLLRRWIAWWAEIGAKTLIVEECPAVTSRDLDYVISWLEEEGFTVRKPRLWGRWEVVLS